MNGKKKHSRPLNNTRWIFATVALFVSLFGLVLSMQHTWEKAVILVCIFYSVAASVFLVAQLVAFVLAHTEYSEEVEGPKFALLEGEEREWAK